MKKPMFLLTGVLAGAAILLSMWLPFALSGGDDKGKAADGALTVIGRTRCIHTRKAIIAPTVLHPVEKVHVKPGDAVKKGDKLVELDADEPKADLRLKEANLAAAEITLQEAKRLLVSVEAVHGRGVLPDQRLHEVRAAAQKAEKDKQAAEAARDASKFELEHYTVEAAIDGVVNRIDVHPGMVSRPGTTVWGEILDLSEIDVICPLTPRELERIEMGQEAEIRALESGRSIGRGKVVFIGLSADAKTGAIPVHLRVANSSGALRSEVSVQVRFSPTSSRK